MVIELSNDTADTFNTRNSLEKGSVSRSDMDSRQCIHITLTEEKEYGGQQWGESSKERHTSIDPSPCSGLHGTVELR